MEHSQLRTLADTAEGSQQSGQNNHLQKQTPG